MATPIHPLDRIRRVLQRVRRQTYGRAVGEVLIRALVACMAVLFVSAVVITLITDNPAVRTLAWLVGLGAPAVYCVIALARVQREIHRDGDLSARIERRVPGFRTDIRAALDLSDAPAPESDDTFALRSMLIERVATDLERRGGDLDRAVPRADLQPVMLLGAMLLFCAAGLFAASSGFRQASSLLWSGPQPTEEELAAINNPPQRPIVSTVDISVVYPAHTNLSPRTVRGSTGDVQAIEGSHIELTAQLMEPVRSATLVIITDTEQRQQLEILGGSSVHATFVATTSGRYVFEVETAGGDTIIDPFPRRIRVDLDQAPRIELLAPPSSVEVSPSDIIDFHFVATDDYGMTDVSLAWHFAGHDDDIRRIPLHASNAGTLVQDNAPLDLAPLLLQPRDEVVAFIEATDNNTFSGPRVGRSRPISLAVAAPDELNQEVMVRKEQLFEALLEQLARMLANPMNAFVANDDATQLIFTPLSLAPEERGVAVSAAIGMHPHWADIMTAFRELLDMMGEDELTVVRDLELVQGSYDAVYEAERDHSGLLDRLQRSAERGMVAAPAFVDLADSDAALVAATERTTLLFEDLVATQQAQAVERTLEELGDIRERLQELLQQYSDTNDPALREQIERELDRLRQRMQELLQQLSSQMQNLPTEHLNMEALEQSDTMENVEQMADAFDEIAQMLENGDIEGAMEALANMGENLDSLMDEFGSMMDQGGSDQLSEFDERMAELMERVNDLELSELEMEQATNELQEEMRREREEEIQEEVAERLARLQEQLQAFRDTFETGERDALGQPRRETLSNLDEDLERLAQLLENEDITGAEDLSNTLISRFGDAARDLRTDASLLRHDPNARRQALDAQRESDGGVDTMDDIGSELRDIMRMAEPRPGPQQSDRLNQLAEQQGQVQQQLQELQQEASEFSERFPAGEQLSEGLEGVGRSMQQAQDSLRNGQPRPALHGEQQALEGLRTMRQQLQQMTQQQRQREQRQGQANPDEVEIPEEGDPGRSAWRDQVVDAMRDDSLESYDEEIRSYYDRLME